MLALLLWTKMILSHSRNIYWLFELLPTAKRRAKQLHYGRLAMKTNVKPHKSCKLWERRQEKTQSNMLTGENDRSLSQKNNIKKKKILYMYGARPDATSQTLLPVFPTQLKSHKIWNKRGQSSDCSRLNRWHRVHGQNCANIHLFRVSGTETGREGKQWLNVFVSVSQKLIAAYLHSRDHTRCSMLNGGEERKKPALL